MPFGLTNAPSTFQALMNEVFRDYVDKFILVYLDDVLIFSRSDEEHKQHVEMVLQRSRDEKLFAKLWKCEFNKSSVSFLGHVVGADGLQMEEKKVEAVVKWPPPANKVEVQSFLGLANYYRRFIKGFSHMEAPLSNLTKKKVSFNWIEPHDVAFDALKTSFTTAPVLKLPDPTKPYVVKTSGIGAVLEQEDDNVFHPVAFASRKLQPAEVRYQVHDLELMAIFYALCEWRVYLHGVSFEIETDHHPLRYLDTQPQLSKQKNRWLDAFAEFDFKLRYVRGKYNLVADALSRMHASTAKSLYTGEDGEDRMKHAAEDANVNAVRVNVLSVGQVQEESAVVRALCEDYTKDSIYSTVYENPGAQFTKSADGLLYDAERRLCVPNGRLRMVLMHDAHDAIVKGHLGFEKCYQDLSRSFIMAVLASRCQGVCALV
jgi:RNase H-like domain found in reverse transcriptase/Reverse transcriptase (RNA-dependent DNA polymerase)